MRFKYQRNIRVSRLNPGECTVIGTPWHRHHYTAYRMTGEGLESRTFMTWPKGYTRAKAWAVGHKIDYRVGDTPARRTFSKAQSEHYIKHGTTDTENYPDCLRR